MKEKIAVILLKVVAWLRKNERWDADRIRNKWTLDTITGIPRDSIIYYKNEKYKILQDIPTNHMCEKW